MQGLPTLWIYLVAALIVAGETAVIFGLLVPGEATLLLVGFLTYNGTLRLGPALLAMIAAAVLGDGLAFRAGRRYGPAARRAGSPGRARAMESGRGHAGPPGWAGVFAARWVAFARTLVPRLAGAAGMPYRRFALWNLAGVATWVSGSVLLGHLAGESYDTVSQWLGRATGVALLLLAGLLGWCSSAGGWVVIRTRCGHCCPGPARCPGAVAHGPLRVLFFLVAMRIGPAWTLLLNLAAGLCCSSPPVSPSRVCSPWRCATVSWPRWTVPSRVVRRPTYPDAADVTLIVVSVVRGSVLIVLVALVAAVLAWRNRPGGRTCSVWSARWARSCRWWCWRWWPS
ncbi:DedA family protein [Micromonospora sp. M12]